jgi:hypothetical protein
MQDIEIWMNVDSAQLALMGETLGRNSISLEGGGAFTNGDKLIAHFLVEEGERAKEVLAAVGINVVKVSPVVIQKLRQDVPGQLGLFCRRLADAGVKILVQYSDHSNQLIIVPDNYEMANDVSLQWKKEWGV